MKTPTREIWIRWCWGICLVFLWCCAILLFVHANGKLSVQELLRYQPESKLLAALALLGLFLLKSVDFLMYSGLLFAISGIVFSLPAAIGLNTVGILIMSAVPYFAGKSLGSPVLKQIGAKYPRFREIEKMHEGGTFVMTFLFHALGLPTTAVGMYMGAKEVPFWPYLLGSVLSLVPKMIPITVMGSTATDFRSPVFLCAAAAEVILFLLALLLYLRFRKKSAG